MAKWTLGFVGLGAMGGPMAQNLLGKGYHVTGFDPSSEARKRFESLGGLSAESPEAVAEKSDVVLTSLPDDTIVRNVYFGSDGLFAGLKSGSAVVELSTIGPETMREIDRNAAGATVKVLDAPVSGGPKECLNGTLAIMVAGKPEVYEEYRELLDELSNVSFHVGEAGAAKTIKLINNIMATGNVLIAAEAIALGVKAGIKADVLYDVLSQSGGRSHHLTKRFPNALKGNFESGFAIYLAEKDLRLAIQMAHQLDTPLFATSVIHQVYEACRAKGLAQMDMVAVLKYYEELTGVEARSEGSKA